MKSIISTFIVFTIFAINLQAQININQGLVAYWKLDGDGKDSSGFNKNGTLMNNPTFATDKNGRNIGAAKFNGTNQYIKFGDILDSVFCKSPIAKFTITGWAKSVTINPNFGAGLIVAKQAGGNGPDQWSVSHFNDSTVRGIVKTSAAFDYVEWKSNSQILPNQWFFFTLMFDGSVSIPHDRVIFLVNDSNTVFSRDNGNFSTYCANSNQEITIGAGHAGGNPNTPVNQYNGYVDEVRIYDRILSPSEITFLYTHLTGKTLIEELEKRSPSIYPNPAKDVLIVDLPDYTSNSSYHILDITGRVLLSGIVNSNKFNINLNGLGAGIYTLIIESGTNYNQIKFVVE